MSASEATGDTSVTAVGEPSLVRAAAPEITRGMVLAGRYQVEAAIGRGGSGIVLRAFDRVAQVPVAVKILKPDLAADPRWIDRFSRELRLARQLHHPNVCRVFDIGQADGHWFITMELAHGGTLRDQLGEKAKGRSLDEKIADVRAVVAGLAAIHEAGIVHRDVKPDNFLRLKEGRLVLSDFGLATNPAEASMVSILVGTPSYMAPEVVLGQQASFRSDVWSLGVVLHELLFGTRPEWTSTSHGPVVVLPSRDLSSIERALASFIEECLQHDTEARPASGSEALAGCERALASKASTWRSRRRRRSQWTWPAVTVACAIAAGIGTGHWWRHATASSSDAARERRTASFQGVAEDWTATTNVVASFGEYVHCMDWLEPDRTLRVVMGSPRRAIDLDVTTREVSPDPLPDKTFALGCPQSSKRGALLFEAIDDGGRSQIMLAASVGEVPNARAVTQGSAPLWLPSGTEFIYSVDDSHAALFSLPVMTTNIINEAADDSGLLVGKSVGPDGTSVALRYVDRSQGRHLVIHGLPSLSVTGRTIFDSAATEFVSSGTSERLAFSMQGPRGRILAELDPESAAVRRLGGVPGRDLGMPTPGRDELAMTAYQIKRDVWRYENGSRTDRLTYDGRSSYPDVSSRGDLIVEHMGLDESFSIRLYEKGRQARDVSAGPQDLTPSFLPDGSGWLYVDGVHRTIRRCSFAGACDDLHVSDDFPFLPVASADGEQIAYITALDRQRLKVLNRRGDIRDLGPARSFCPPHWTSDGHIWLLQGTDRDPLWAELDSKTGEQVATLRINETIHNDSRGCSLLSAPPGVLHPPEVAAWTAESTEIRLLHH